MGVKARNRATSIPASGSKERVTKPTLPSRCRPEGCVVLAGELRLLPARKRSSQVGCLATLGSHTDSEDHNRSRNRDHNLDPQLAVGEYDYDQDYDSESSFAQNCLEIVSVANYSTGLR